MFRNVKALILNDRGIWRRGGNHTTTISSPVSRTESLETQRFKASFFVPVHMIFSSEMTVILRTIKGGESYA